MGTFRILVQMAPSLRINWTISAQWLENRQFQSEMWVCGTRQSGDWTQHIAAITIFRMKSKSILLEIAWLLT